MPHCSHFLNNVHKWSEKIFHFISQHSANAYLDRSPAHLNHLSHNRLHPNSTAPRTPLPPPGSGPLSSSPFPQVLSGLVVAALLFLLCSSVYLVYKVHLLQIKVIWGTDLKVIITEDLIFIGQSLNVSLCLSSYYVTDVFSSSVCTLGPNQI